jgi:PLP dependent protein
MSIFLALSLSSTRSLALITTSSTSSIRYRTFRAVRELSAMSEATTVDISLNLQDVRNRIQAAMEKSTNDNAVQLVAVSKTKPVELLMAAYDQGQRVFGENYAQELMDKAQLMPQDVHWHYIGTLQSNKVNGLVKSVITKAASLTVETVSSLKVAKKLNSAMETICDEDPNLGKDTLSIFVQVNTSGEDSKSGIEPSDVVSFCREIKSTCDKLQLKGLMTIGAEGDVSCFDCLVQCQNEVSDALGIPLEELELSMGMSGDFEEAIAKGATNVRIGSTIFGARDYSK